ncbi:MAG: hypothetical protein A3H44_01530 [Gammaproteobacteria bacterium RIFCSPLOWO2_02_FULL_57_10]|nr:MAG: hypothetical protein A3H44_01530 [Gammaproteobacteria bacterium RIFCSPLOWO2_02_FULL_57_10]
MNIRKYHRIVGIVMLTPLMTWALTGMVFLIQPGYGAAYEMLSPRTYPLTEATTLPAGRDWSEFRYLRTILGEHLLVRNQEGWQHLDPLTVAAAPAPQETALRALVSDAIAHDPARYGEVSGYDGSAVQTSTGVSITLDWNTLSLRQTGNDTRWIDQLYQIHYLQWTGIRALDKVLGIVGLCLLLLMTLTGFKLVFRKS